MKPWHVTYRERGSWGFYVEYDFIVFAKNFSDAITLAHAQTDDTVLGSNWSANELKPEGAHFITSARS